MFDTLLRRLLAPLPDRLPPPEEKLALGALMVRLARSDGSYSTAEVARIDKVFGAIYGLAPAAAALLREDAEVLEAEAPDTVRFTRALKEAVPHEERSRLLEGLWQVALADGKRGDDEETLMRLVSSLLGIGDVDSALARQRAERA
jgi:uncharacterized tellurite resistance protein B-like protein